MPQQQTDAEVGTAAAGTQEAGGGTSAAQTPAAEADAILDVVFQPVPQPFDFYF